MMHGGVVRGILGEYVEGFEGFMDVFIGSVADEAEVRVLAIAVEEVEEGAW